MAFAFSPGGGTVGWGRDAIVAFAFSRAAALGWGRDRESPRFSSHCFSINLRSKTPFPALPSERVAYSPVLLNPAGFEPRIPPVCNSGPVYRL